MRGVLVRFGRVRSRVVRLFISFGVEVPEVSGVDPAIRCCQLVARDHVHVGTLPDVVIPERREVLHSVGQ